MTERHPLEPAALRSAADRVRPLHSAKRRPGPNDWLATHPEPGETFAEYQAAHPRPPTRGLSSAYVQPVGAFTPAQRQIVGSTAEFLGLFFGADAQLLDTLPDEAIPARARRRHPTWGNEQILSPYILDAVLKPRRPVDAMALLGLAAADLWPGPGWNFVFGQASLNERVGVWSMYRYGDPNESEQAYRTCLLRTLKVATHEMGHMLGLLHCKAFECGMNGSNHLDEMDNRPLPFCPECAPKVWWARGLEPAGWFDSLAECAGQAKLVDEECFWAASRQAVAAAVAATGR